MKTKSVLYAITKQIRQFEPIRIEVTVEAETGDDDSVALIERARDLAEAAMSDAEYRRGNVITAAPLR